jgi:hypothetical protein
MRGVHNDPLQVFERQSIWEQVSKGGTFLGARRYVPFSIRSIRRCGVPTAIPVRFFWRNETCSSSLKCFAN